MKPLLVMDGDSFAHRAYHALPSSMRREDGGPANALIGFSDMLMRLWRDERPRTVLVAWDTLDVPTYRHEALDAYQSGRVFEDELLEQLDLLPALVASMGFAYAKAAGYEADDFLAAAAAQEEAAGGTALVATSDRDAFQLVTDRVTVLQPAKGVPARIGPAEVRERYGVDPAQVPDFIALRGDPSDKIPERAASARSAARSSSRSTGRSTRCSRRAASPPRRTRFASTAASRRWTATRRCPRFRTSRRTGRLPPSTRRSSGRFASRSASRRPRAWT